MARKQTKVLQAPEAASAANDGDEKVDRKKVSKRSFITANGGEAEKMEDSAGARYELLGGSKPLVFDYVFGQNPTADKFYANFGFHTKVGNVANTVLNDKSDPGTPDDAGDSIKEFMDGVNNGVWAERTGGVGAKIDLDALAGAIVECAESKGKELDVREIREKLEGDKALVRKMRQVPEIATAYNARVGKVVSLDDALSGL